MKTLCSLLFYILMLSLLGCAKETGGNLQPKYDEGDFIMLNKLHEISNDAGEGGEYYIPIITNIAVDDGLNLYIVDQFESNIKVFDENGKYTRTMGSKGQGPRELESPGLTTIRNNELYIYQFRQGLKVWDLEGNYKRSTPRKNLPNPQIIKPMDGYYIGLGITLKMTGTSGSDDSRQVQSFTHELKKLTPDFEDISTILTQVSSPEEMQYFSLAYNHAFNSKNEFYGTTMERDTYIFNKYDLEGNLLKAFSRVYERKPYSQEVKDGYYEQFKKRIDEGKQEGLAGYPPVVRYIFVDEQDYVWVLVGEYAFDARSPVSVKTTVDVFDDEGMFLYTFQNEDISRNAFIKHGRLYSVKNSAGLNGESSIAVYEIKYLK